MGIAHRPMPFREVRFLKWGPGLADSLTVRDMPPLRQAFLGGTAILVGFVLGEIDRRHRAAFGHTLFDTLDLVCWALVIFGLIVTIVGLIGHWRAQPHVAAIDAPAAPGKRWRAWMTLAITWSMLTAFMIWVFAAGIVDRTEGHVQPRDGAVVFEALLVIGFALLARAAFRAGRRARLISQDAASGELSAD